MGKYICFIISISLSQSSFAQNPGSFYFTITSPSNIYQSLEPGEYSSVDNGWGWNGTITNDFLAELVYVTDQFGDHDFCEKHFTNYTNKVVLIDRGLCDFSLKAYNAQQQGALAVVIQNFEDNLITMAPGDSGIAVTIPCIFIKETLGSQLVNELTLGSTVMVSFSHTAHPVLRINGTVNRDNNEDCLFNPGEIGLNHWKVFTQSSNGRSHISYSDENGHYQVFVDTGNYELSLIPPSPAWQVCPSIAVQSIQFDSIRLDLPATALINCPLMSVDIEAPVLRRCFDNNLFYVNYCNLGTDLADSAYITVQFDPLIIVKSSSHSFIDLGNNTYEFSIGDVASNECGSFTITTLVSCEAELSQTICAYANIFPPVNCGPDGENYSGPSIKVTGECSGDYVSFHIENIGDGNMNTLGQYKAYRNAHPIETGTFILTAGNSTSLHYPADGGTYRLEAEQAVGFPQASAPGYTLEGCTSGSGSFDKGFFNIFPSVDYGSDYDQCCLAVIGSLDPNDKTPTPMGFDIEHYVEQNTDLHYVIRFQNTGNDTAFTVIVRDTLSEAFDLSSLVLGPSSHPYSFHVLDNNVLEFVFSNILLPDSTINETASHGYLTYDLKQQKDLPLGTIIQNEAAIYFDYNEPVITNKTFHTIGKDFLETGIAELNNLVSVNVYPNPFTDHVTFNVQEINFRECQVEIFNCLGQLIRSETSRERTFDLKSNTLKEGLYFYKLNLDKKWFSFGSILLLDH